MALSLNQQSQLAEDGDFRRRVQQAAVSSAVNITNEVANEVQRITITGSPTGGTFTIAYNGSTTATIAFNATASVVQAALQAIASVGNNNIICIGGPFPATAITMTFIGTLANLPLNLMTIGTNSLTGGASPTPTPSRITTGVTVFNHSARQVFANKVVNNPTGYSYLMAPTIATDATVQNDYTGGPGAWALAVTESTADTDLKNAVSAAWNTFI